MSATQAERRSNIEHEFFEITDEIKEAMKRACIDNKNRYPDIDGKSQTEGKNNFREYDQTQSFFANDEEEHDGAVATKIKYYFSNDLRVAQYLRIYRVFQAANSFSSN